MLTRCEEMLRPRANALMQQDLANAFPVLLRLAEVAGALGQWDKRATSLLNAAISLLQTDRRAEARSWAEQALPLFAADSDDAAMARKVIAYCVDA